MEQRGGANCQVREGFNVNSSHFLPFSFWRVAPIAALLHGKRRKHSVSAQGCKLQLQQGKERPWDKVRRWQPWVVLPVSLSHADGACRASGPAQPSDSIRLIWLCPLLLPWWVREGWVASSGHAMATGLGEGPGWGKTWDPETPGKKEDLRVVFCLFHLRPDCCRQPTLFFPFPKHIWVCS